MKKSVVILTLLTSLFTVLYHVNNLKKNDDKFKRVTPVTPSIDAPPSLVFNKPAKSSIANIGLWNLNPYIPVGQMMSLKDMFKPVYSINKNGRHEYLGRSDRPNENWAFQGVIVQEKHVRALMYNVGLNKMKIVSIGEKLDENLTLKAIKTESVMIEAKDEKKAQNFELHIFNTQKDTYALKRKQM